MGAPAAVAPAAVIHVSVPLNIALTCPLAQPVEFPTAGGGKALSGAAGAGEDDPAVPFDTTVAGLLFAAEPLGVAVPQYVAVAV